MMGLVALANLRVHVLRDDLQVFWKNQVCRQPRQGVVVVWFCDCVILTHRTYSKSCTRVVGFMQNECSYSQLVFPTLPLLNQIRNLAKNARNGFVQNSQGVDRFVLPLFSAMSNWNILDVSGCWLPPETPADLGRHGSWNFTPRVGMVFAFLSFFPIPKSDLGSRTEHVC